MLQTHTERGDCAQDEAAKGLFLLETEGFKSAYMLDGGMRAWHDAVLYPVKALESIRSRSRSRCWWQSTSEERLGRQAPRHRRRSRFRPCLRLLLR